MAANTRTAQLVIRLAVFAVIAALAAGGVMVFLGEEAELAAWELLLLVLLIIFVRLTPRALPDDVGPLFGGVREEASHAPRSVASFELASVHAFSESPGADRRLKIFMGRVARHRLKRLGLRPGSNRAAELIDPALFAEGRQPLTATQIERIVSQMERL